MCANVCFLQVTCVEGRLAVPPSVTRRERAKGESFARVNQRERQRATARVLSAGLKPRPPEMHGAAVGRIGMPEVNLRPPKMQNASLSFAAARRCFLVAPAARRSFVFALASRARARKRLGRFASAVACPSFESAHITTDRPYKSAVKFSTGRKYRFRTGR